MGRRRKSNGLPSSSLEVPSDFSTVVASMQSVCVFVREHISETGLRVRSSPICACYLWPWLDPPRLILN